MDEYKIKANSKGGSDDWRTIDTFDKTSEIARLITRLNELAPNSNFRVCKGKIAREKMWLYFTCRIVM